MRLVFIACDGASGRGSEAENGCLCLLKGRKPNTERQKVLWQLSFYWLLSGGFVVDRLMSRSGEMKSIWWDSYGRPPRITLHRCDAHAPLLCSVGCAWTKDLQISLCALSSWCFRRPQGSGLISEKEPREGRTRSQSTFPPLFFDFTYIWFIFYSLTPSAAFAAICLRSVPSLIYLPSFCCRATAGPGRRRSSWAWSCVTTASCITVLVPPAEVSPSSFPQPWELCRHWLIKSRTLWWNHRGRLPGI